MIDDDHHAHRRQYRRTRPSRARAIHRIQALPRFAFQAAARLAFHQRHHHQRPHENAQQHLAISCVMPVHGCPHALLAAFIYSTMAMIRVRATVVPV
jgi:hypothetical protein